MQNIAETLFETFSDGRMPREKDFHTGKMFLLLQDPFGLWCSYHAPKEEAVEEQNIYENLRGKTDRNTRDSWIYQNCKNPVLILASNDAERFKKTLQAMEKGNDGIIGAHLWDLRNKEGGLWGSVNLLLRVENKPSIFGSYSYKIVQLKRAADLKEHYAMQTVLMSEILQNIQQSETENALFILRNKQQTLECKSRIEKAKELVSVWKEIRNGFYVPDGKKPPKAALSPWRVYANKILFERKDLVLLAHLNAQMRQALRLHGIYNYDDVANAGLDKIKSILKEPLATQSLAFETYCHAKAYQANLPVRREGYPFPPPQKKRNLYFDFEATETFTREAVSFIYLIGLWDKEENKFVSFIARNEREEEKIFKDFADYVLQEDDTTLYHWTEYEVKKMQSLAEKYPSLKQPLSALVAKCTDLKIEVERAFFLPSPSLSLKAAAPAFGFKWRQDDCGAMDSMVYFTNWLKTEDEKLLAKVLMYNEDDCKAMLFIEEKLKNSPVIEIKNQL